MERVPFSSLPPETQEVGQCNVQVVDSSQAIRRKQKETKAAKEAAIKKRKEEEALAAENDAEDSWPCSITIDQYFEASPMGQFCDRSLGASSDSVDLLLQLVAQKVQVGEGTNRATGETVPISLDMFNYFKFVGPEAWSPELYAKLAYEGFFTITSHGNPLPELQPFYSVVEWKNFHNSHHVKKALRRLKKQTQLTHLTLAVSQDVMAVWDAIDKQHKAQHGSNWLSKRYLDTMAAASKDPNNPLTMHSVELYWQGPDGKAQGDHGTLIAGELGYSIGGVYTSLSGFSRQEAVDLGTGVGTAQLVLLGLLLEKSGYDFWSMGHCYSPMMDYKRQLGHRVLPREAFLERLKSCRGSYTGPSSSEHIGEKTLRKASDLVS